MLAPLADAIDGVATVDVAALGPALGDHIAALLAARHRLDGELERAIAAYDAGGFCELDGARTTASWLRGQTRMAPSEASVRVSTARYLRELPETAAALAAGRISLDHARAVAMLAAETDIAATRSVAHQLIEVASLTDPVRFARELRVIRDNYKPQPGPRPDDTAYDRRRFSVAVSLEGSFSLGGWLPGEGGAILRTALDTLATPVPGDTRTPTQRYADALVELARRQLDGGELPANHGVRPHLVVVTELDGGGTGDSGPTAPPPTGTDELSGAGVAATASRSTGLSLTRGVIVSGGSLDRRALERITCDSTVSRLLIRSPGEVLDLGRAQRVVTVAQWKALVLRDKGCVMPGHDCPPIATQAHHLKHWLLGGLTNVNDMALVCTYSHRIVHEGGFTLYLRDGDRRWILRRPDGTEIEGHIIGETGSGLSGATKAILNGPRGPCPE